MSKTKELLDLTPLWGDLVGIVNYYGDLSFKINRLFEPGLVMKAKKGKENFKLLFKNDSGLYLPEYVRFRKPEETTQDFPLITQNSRPRMSSLQDVLEEHFDFEHDERRCFSKAEIEEQMKMPHYDLKVYEYDIPFYGNQAGDNIRELENKIKSGLRKSIDADFFLFRVELAREGKYFQLLADLIAYTPKPAPESPKSDKPKIGSADARMDDFYDPAEILSLGEMNNTIFLYQLN